MVAILDTSALPVLRMTVDEYLQADLPEGHSYELVDGEIQMAPTPGGGHDTVLDRLMMILVTYRQQYPDQIAHLSFNAGVPIPGRQTVREPDLALYRQWEGEGRGWSVWKEVTPFLAIEVTSPDSGRRDHVEKREDYWSAGLAEYWVVDESQGTVTVLTRGQRQWDEHVCRAGDSIESAMLPGLLLPVADVLGGKK